MYRWGRTDGGRGERGDKVTLDFGTTAHQLISGWPHLKPYNPFGQHCCGADLNATLDTTLERNTMCPGSIQMYFNSVKRTTKSAIGDVTEVHLLNLHQTMLSEKEIKRHTSHCFVDIIMIIKTKWWLGDSKILGRAEPRWRPRTWGGWLWRCRRGGVLRIRRSAPPSW